MLFKIIKITDHHGDTMSRGFWNVGRFFYSVPLTITGLIYIYKPQGTVESLTSFIPGELRLIYVAGVLWVILGSLIALNILTKYATWGVIGLLALYQIMVHIPAVYAGEYLNVVWFELLRDLSLMGGAFFILAVECYGEDSEQAKSQEFNVSIQ